MERMFPFPNFNLFALDPKGLLLSIFCATKGEDVYSEENQKLTPHLLSLQSNITFLPLSFSSGYSKLLFLYLCIYFGNQNYFSSSCILRPFFLVCCYLKNHSEIYFFPKMLVSSLFRGNRKAQKATKSTCFNGLVVGGWIKNYIFVKNEKLQGEISYHSPNVPLIDFLWSGNILVHPLPGFLKWM